MENTIDYYNENAEIYYEKTISADLKDIYKDFLRSVPKGGKILDLGCGSGRDSLYFKNKGYIVTLVDGSYKLAKKAKKLLNQEVLVMNFENLLLNETFDGIWCCASLLHVKKAEFKGMLEKIISYLTKQGIIYMSFKYGEFEYIDENNRYFNCYTEESIKKVLENIKALKIEKVYTTVDVIGNRNNLTWLNILCSKE